MKQHYIKPEQYIELAAELAAAMLEYSSLDPITEIDENGDERLTEEKQDEFNMLLDQVEAMLAAGGIHKE